MATSVGEFNEYTDGPTSFEPEDLPTAYDASEFRDFGGDAPVSGADRPTDTSAVSAGAETIVRETGRRLIQSDGSNAWSDVDEVQNVAARTYATSVIWVHPSADYAAPVPTMLLANDQARMRVLVSVPTVEGETSGVIIGSLTDIQSGVGFFLAPGTSTEVKVQGAVYVTFPNWSANPQTPLPVTLWIERGL